MAKKICRYVLNASRSANLEGVFVLNDFEFEALKNRGRVYYGEVSGKHSDVKADLNSKDIQILSENEQEVAFFERILPQGAGFNFKDYWFCEDDASDNGYECGCASSTAYANATEALEEFRQYDNDILREAFIKSFEKARSKK